MEKKEVKFTDALIPIVGLLIVIIYGLVIHPRLSNKESFPLEVIFLLASTISIVNLKRMNISWEKIEKSVIKKLSEGLPAFFILFSIGVLIGSWVISGTVPMMIYYGIKIINPDYIYLVAFIVPAIFSTVTGTSWGSAGTIGVVLIGVATVIDANLAAVAGAIVGGSYFGDKMSPLSDTTNMAAIGTGVDLYDHIRSMVNTTVPAAVLTAICYYFVGRFFKVSSTGVDMSQINVTLESLDSVFNWNILLLIPIIIVVYGSIKRKPTVPTLIISAIVAFILSFIFQKFTLDDIISCMNTGFKVDMVTWSTNITPEVKRLLSRGGLYELNTSITTALMVFFYIGTLDVIGALQIVVDKVFSFASTRRTVIFASQMATAITIAMTSNQHATSFIVGGAFRKKYDDVKVPRMVLSRSIEDFGTMLEPILPWTTTGLYMAKTLGIPVFSYAPWQFLSIFNFAIAIILGTTGIGCFYHLIKGDGENKGDEIESSSKYEYEEKREEDSVEEDEEIFENNEKEGVVVE